ncbi:conserved protein of unknown function [Shewanella benthica]|uniref:Uncharacterized protein n=1 Tax=Shewanella benthica TaxID=43661 RepID=A0A330M710_9GAMM|nr:hypothetical protein [Shewanella benthica]SQH77755.1 conserved protein of unknown function [Shewanella benthica]
MQINSNAQQNNAVYGTTKSMTAKAPISAYQAEVVAVKPLPSVIDSITLSAEAMALSKQPPATSKEVEILPSSPTLLNEREKVDNYLEYRKAKAQQQQVSTMQTYVKTTQSIYEQA